MPSTDVIQLTLILNMTTPQVVETSITVNNNSPIQDYVHQDDQTQPTFEIFFLEAFIRTGNYLLLTGHYIWQYFPLSMERIIATIDWQEKHIFIFCPVFTWGNFSLSSFEDCPVSNKICKNVTNHPLFLNVDDDRKFV